MIFIQHIAPNPGYRYFRLTIDKIVSTLTSQLPIYSWDIYDGSAWTVTTMTSNSAPSPNVASMIDAGADAYKTHDGSSATFAQPAGTYASQVKSPSDWHKLDVGSGNGFMPTKIRVAWYNTGGYDLTGVDFVLAGSNDDSAWTTLKSWTGQTSKTHQTLTEYTI